jgi:hypothetical protein
LFFAFFAVHLRTAADYRGLTPLWRLRYNGLGRWTIRPITAEEDTGMGFLDQVKQSGQRAAWEAERMVRVNKANSAVADAKRDLDSQIYNLGKTMIAAFEGGATPSAEAQPVYDQIKALEDKVKQLEQELERIKQEQPPGMAPQPAPPPGFPSTAQGAPYPPPGGGAPYTAPGQGTPYTPTGPVTGPGPYTPTGPTAGPGPATSPGPYSPASPVAPGPYTPTGPAADAGPYMPTGPSPETPSGPGATGATAYGGPAYEQAAAPATADATPGMAPGSTAKVFCQNCGVERKDPTAMFCQECGTRYS